MRRTVRSLRLDVPPARAFAACLQLLETPDPRRGVVARVSRPSPPRPGSVVVTTVRGRGEPRELRSRVVALQPPWELATETIDATPAVRTVLRVESDGEGSRVKVSNEVDTGLGEGRAAALLDAVIFARAQRRAAVATLRRVRELASG